VSSLRIAWPADVQALFRPASTYRELARLENRGAAAAARPLLLLFVLGCVVSLIASGRLSVRLIVDGSFSFAFLPACCVAGFAIVYFVRRERPVAFGRALDLFFIGQMPWLIWLIVFASVGAIVEPRRMGPWLRRLEWSVIVPFVWTAIIDFHFFREVMGRAPGAAVRDLVLYRAIAWGAATLYFFGIAIWYEVVPVVVDWVNSPW
jgi:hypothetical protein